MTLIEKVQAVLTAIAPSGQVDPMQAVAIYPTTGNGGELSDFEMDCRDWGFAFGVAYAIARSEDPFESNHSVCERAIVAAREAFSRASGARIFNEQAFHADRELRGAARGEDHGIGTLGDEDRGIGTLGDEDRGIGTLGDEDRGLGAVA